MTPGGSATRPSDSGACARRGDFLADDLGLFEATTAPWELVTRPFGRTPFQHWKDYLVTPRIVVYREWFASRLQVRGLSPPGMLTLSLPLCRGDRSRYWNRDLAPDTVPVMLPGEIDALVDLDQAHLIVFVDLELLTRVLNPAQHCVLMQAAGQRRIRTSTGAARRLARWLTKLLDDTRNNPTVLHHPEVMRAIEDELVHRIVQLAEPTPRAPRPPVSRRYRGLRRALDALHADLPLLTVTDLCTAANVSQRTLEYAFRETFGITPVGFLRRCRLHAAHCALRRAPPGSVTVSDIAHRSGFVELGRFAQAYAERYGERPSQTLGHQAEGDRATCPPLLW